MGNVTDSSHLKVNLLKKMTQLFSSKLDCFNELKFYYQLSVWLSIIITKELRKKQLKIINKFKIILWLPFYIVLLKKFNLWFLTNHKNR